MACLYIILDINSISCPPLLSTIKKGNLICSRPNMRNVWSPNQVVNRPGTKCYLKCSKDYQLIGEYQITCNADGNWIGAKTGECLSKFQQLNSLYRRNNVHL